MTVREITSSHLVMIVEILVLKVLISVTSFCSVGTNLFSNTEFSNTGFSNLVNLIWYTYLRICFIVSLAHLHGVKNCPQKSRLIKY